MKKFTFTLKGMVSLALLSSSLLTASTTNDSLIFQFFQQTKKDFIETEFKHSLKMDILSTELEKANQNIFKAVSESPENLCGC